MAIYNSASLLTFEILNATTVSMEPNVVGPRPAGTIIDANGNFATTPGTAMGINRFDVNVPMQQTNQPVYPDLVAGPVRTGARYTVGSIVYQARYSFTSTGTDTNDTSKWVTIGNVGDVSNMTPMYYNYNTQLLPRYDLTVVTDGIYPVAVAANAGDIAKGQLVTISIADPGKVEITAENQPGFGIALDAFKAAERPSTNSPAYIRVQIAKSTATPD